MIKLFIIAALLVITGCTTKQDAYIGAIQVPLPNGIFMQEKKAIAYKPIDINVKTGLIKLSIKSLIPDKKESVGRYQVYAVSNKSFNLVSHRQQDRELITKFIPGATYIVRQAAQGQVELSLNSLCRIALEYPKPDKTFIPKICTQIFCVNEAFTERQLFERFDLPYGGGGGVPIQLGGWNPVPPNLCQSCTMPGLANLGDPTIEWICPSARTGGCNSGEVLFNDNFEMDTVGTPPATSPAGDPPGDSITSSGDVTVINDSSKVVRLNRGSPFATLNSVLASGATESGSYCIQFTGKALGVMQTPISVELQSSGGVNAFVLNIDHDSATLNSGGTSVTFIRDFTQARDIRFQLDLDDRSFDMYIDNSRVAENISLMDLSFDSPSNLNFTIGQCILECFPASYTVDNIKVTKLN